MVLSPTRFSPVPAVKPIDPGVISNQVGASLSPWVLRKLPLGAAASSTQAVPLLYKKAPEAAAVPTSPAEG